MLITKNHINSMAELSEKDSIALLDVIEKIKKKLCDTYDVIPIVFEHGSGNVKTENASSSIKHAHIHIVPINFCKNTNSEIIKESKMNEFDIRNQFVNYCDEPYILYIDENHTSFISKSADVILRKWVAKESNNPTIWNWKEDILLENVKSTVEKLNYRINI